MPAYYSLEAGEIFQTFFADTSVVSQRLGRVALFHQRQQRTGFGRLKMGASFAHRQVMDQAQEAEGQESEANQQAAVADHVAPEPAGFFLVQCAGGELEGQQGSQ